jgi:hypothetical protein
MICFGERSLHSATVSFLDHYHAERNHQGIGNSLITPEPEVGGATGEIACRERLGSTLRYYYRLFRSRHSTGKPPDLISLLMRSRGDAFTVIRARLPHWCHFPPWSVIRNCHSFLILTDHMPRVAAGLVFLPDALFILRVDCRTSAASTP